MGAPLRIAFLGNFSVDYSSESHHAGSLASLGHEVQPLQEPRASADEIVAAAERAGLFIWIHTHGWDTPGMAAVLAHLASRRIPTMTYHLDLWHGLHRERDMHTDPYWQIGHFFTADANMADYLNEKTPVRGHYMPAAVYGAECYIAEGIVRHRYANDVIFVGQRNYHPEWPYRPQLIDWLAHTYGDRFTRIAGDCPSGTVRGHALNTLYASSKVVVGDTLCLGYNYPNYWSDRVYETLGRGGFMIHPRVPGMDKHFTDGEHLAFYDYGNFEQLKYWIDCYLDEECERDAVRLAGHQHVKDHHTYRHRWADILAALA
jgi:hypothetical protein